MNKIAVARRVTEKIQTAENSIDTSIADVSRLLIAMTEARQELKLGAGAGSDAFSKLGEAMAALNQARVAIVAAHADLSVVQGQLGIRTTMSEIPGGWQSPQIASIEAVESERRAG